jgi:hypothetical protein
MYWLLEVWVFMEFSWLGGQVTVNMPFWDAVVPLLK